MIRNGTSKPVSFPRPGWGLPPVLRVALWPFALAGVIALSSLLVAAGLMPVIGGAGLAERNVQQRLLGNISVPLHLPQLGVQEGVSEGVIEGVKEEVSVTEAVQVAGTNGVKVIVLVVVVVGVRVEVGVVEAVIVTTGGVKLTVGERGVVVDVNVSVMVGVRSEGFGASATAIQPMQ